MNRPNGPGASFQSKFSKQRLGGGGERRQMFQFPSQTKPKKAEEEWEDWDSSPLLGSKSIISVRDESSERAGRHSSGVDEWDKSPWVQNPKKPTTNLSTAESPSDAAPILPDSTSQADSIVLWADEPRNVEVRTTIKSDHFGQEEDWDSSQPAFQNRRKQTDFFANKKSDGEIGWTTPEKEGGRSKAEEAPQMQKSRIQNEHLFYGEMKTSHEAAASADRLARAQESLLKKMSESTVSDIEVVKPPLFAGGGEPMVVDEVNRDTEQLTAADESLLNKLVHSKLEELRDAEVTITNLQQDPCSPLFSVKSFEELHLRDELTKGVADMGFNQPSRIQETALAVILSDPPINMIAQSQSGTGKTAAFVLTMLTRTEMSKKYPQCLCLAPTYELAVQIGQVVEKMGRYLPEIKVAYAVRGRKISNGHKVKEQIIIGTPGTTLDWILKYKAFDAMKIHVFVLDEADVMISQQGHQDQSMRIDKTLKNCQQKLLFSATYDDQVMEFAQKIIPNPAVITVRREEQSLDNIRQYYVKCFDKEAKYRALANLYGVLTIGQCIVFCSTRKTANWLSSRLFADGHAVGILSGELDILQRASIIQRFKRGNEKVLISTNVSARGIDVQQVSLVINYDMPITVNGTTDFETYLHRIGRTGRFGKAGIAVNFVDSHWSFAIMQEIEEHFGKKIKQLDTENPDELERVEEGKH